MSIKIAAKTDYSSLFDSLPKNKTSNLTASVLGASTDMTSLLTDYSTIKSGSYSKLLKAYYAKQASSTESTTAGKEETTKETSEKETESVDKTKSTYTSNASYSQNTSVGSMLDSLI